jgi:hypothetical protein
MGFKDSIFFKVIGFSGELSDEFAVEPDKEFEGTVE